MMASGVLAWVAGFPAPGPVVMLLLLHFISSRSCRFRRTDCRAGEVTALNARGAAMAVYSFGGFGAGFLAPLVFGAVLDVAGARPILAWGSPSEAWASDVSSPRSSRGLKAIHAKFDLHSLLLDQHRAHRFQYL